MLTPTFDLEEKLPWIDSQHAQIIWGLFQTFTFLSRCLLPPPKRLSSAPTFSLLLLSLPRVCDSKGSTKSRANGPLEYSL